MKVYEDMSDSRVKVRKNVSNSRKVFSSTTIAHLSKPLTFSM